MRFDDTRLHSFSLAGSGSGGSRFLGGNRVRPGRDGPGRSGGRCRSLGPPVPAPRPRGSSRQRASLPISASALIAAREDGIENAEAPAGLGLIFRTHALIAGLVGAQHLIFPRFWTDLAGMEIDETTTWRLIGAALLALAVGSWMAAGETRWARVRILVALELVWSVLGAIVITWGILAEGLPPLEWLNVVLLVGFAVAFGVAYRAAPAVPRPSATDEGGP